MEVRVISIGTLPAHPLWHEKGFVRTGHATSTLIRTDEAVILVDPGLPERAIEARLSERAGIGPESVTHVFLTSFKADTCRGIGAFGKASWLVSQAEREMVGQGLVTLLTRASEIKDEALVKELEQQVSVLRACKEAPDQLAKGVDLFPLPGVTPGLCGLLVSELRGTTLICGDAIPTTEHLIEAKVLPGAPDVEAAKASFAEAIEIADLLVLGRDNAVNSPGGRDGGGGLF